MRGGTSKAVFLMENHLSRDEGLRKRIILSIFGSPDTKQIDGLGGADFLTSKCAVIGAISIGVVAKIEGTILWEFTRGATRRERLFRIGHEVRKQGVPAGFKGRPWGGPHEKSWTVMSMCAKVSYG